MAAFPGKTQQELSVLEALIAGHSVFTFGAPPCVYDPDSESQGENVGQIGFDQKTHI